MYAAIYRPNKTNLSVKNIAYELNYDNISYFTRLFKCYTNKTHVEYRSNFSQ
ncbi:MULTISPECIES: helix-turn-helix domain-containing protein [Dysgonomonas]|uniref:helix-turn-helix domain-containing protein n=1 Tax=Dysgonomonas TaxID=156973 RepID=UPI00333F595B